MAYPLYVSYDNLPSYNLDQQSVILYTFPVGDVDTLASVLEKLSGSVASVYITDVDIAKEDVYKSWGSLFPQLVKDIPSSSAAGSSSTIVA